MEFMEFFPTWQRDSWWPRFIDRWPWIRMRPFMAFTFSMASRGIGIGMRKGLGLAKRAERTGKIKDGGCGAEIETTATTLIDI